MSDQAPKWGNVPSAPISNSDGGINNTWRAFHSNNMENLIGYFTPDGYVLPSRSADYIASLTGDKYKNRIIINSTDNTLMVNLTGTFVTVMTI